MMKNVVKKVPKNMPFLNKIKQLAKTLQNQFIFAHSVTFGTGVCNYTETANRKCPIRSPFSLDIDIPYVEGKYVIHTPHRAMKSFGDK